MHVLRYAKTHTYLNAQAKLTDKVRRAAKAYMWMIDARPNKAVE